MSESRDGESRCGWQYIYESGESSESIDGESRFASFNSFKSTRSELNALDICGTIQKHKQDMANQVQTLKKNLLNRKNTLQRDLDIIEQKLAQIETAEGML